MLKVLIVLFVSGFNQVDSVKNATHKETNRNPPLKYSETQTANQAILNIKHVVKVKPTVRVKKQRNSWFFDRKVEHASAEKLAYDRKLAYEDYYDSITGAKFIDDDYIEQDFDEAQLVSPKKKPRSEFPITITSTYLALLFVALGLVSLALDKLNNSDKDQVDERILP